MKQEEINEWIEVLKTEKIIMQYRDLKNRFKQGVIDAKKDGCEFLECCTIGALYPVDISIVEKTSIIYDVYFEED